MVPSRRPRVIVGRRLAGCHPMSRLNMPSRPWLVGAAGRLPLDQPEGTHSQFFRVPRLPEVRAVPAPVRDLARIALPPFDGIVRRPVSNLQPRWGKIMNTLIERSQCVLHVPQKISR